MIYGRRTGKSVRNTWALDLALAENNKRVLVMDPHCSYVVTRRESGIEIELAKDCTWEDFKDTYGLLALREREALDSSPVDSSSDAIPLDYSARKNETALSRAENSAQRTNDEVKPCT
jgi:hypothetical protein